MHAYNTYFVTAYTYTVDSFLPGVLFDASRIGFSVTKDACWLTHLASLESYLVGCNGAEATTVGWEEKDGHRGPAGDECLSRVR